MQCGCWLHDCPYSSPLPHTSHIFPVQRGLHDWHSPPPPPTHTHTSLSLPELCWLHDCLACVCAAPSCVDVPEDCSIYFWEPLHQQCRRDVIFNSSTGAYDWVVNMDCVDSRSQTLDCQALRQLLRNPQPRRNARRNGYRDSGKFLIVIGWVVSSLVRCSVGDLFMIWVSGCITVAGLVLGETEGRNYDVLLGPVKKRLFLTRLHAYVYFDLWVQTDPISKQNTMRGSFLKQRSSTSKQIWFQAAVDSCATTWTGPSTAPELADLFQRISVPFCAPMWCTHLPSWEGTIWRPLSGMTRAQTGHVSCHQKLLPLLLRSPAEHCGGHPVHYNIFCQYCPRWEGLRRGAIQRGICRASRPSPNATLDRRGQLNEGVMFGELRVLLFVLVVCMGGWEWMCEWMSLPCRSCAPTLDRGDRCLGPDLQCPR